MRILSLEPLTLGVPVHCATGGIVVSRASSYRARSKSNRIGGGYGDVEGRIEAVASRHEQGTGGRRTGVQLQSIHSGKRRCK